VSEQDHPGPPEEEPLIGGATPSSPLPGDAPSDPGRDARGAVIGVPPETSRRAVDPWELQHLRRDTRDLRTYGRDGPGAGYYGATQRPAGRTAAIYFFTLATLVIGGILIFLLFQVLNEGGDNPAEPLPPAVEAVARIESPTPGARITQNEELTVIVSVVAGEDIVRFELFVTGIITDQEFTVRKTGKHTYASVLTASFDAAGAYDLVVRAYTASGQQVISDAIQIVVVPPTVATPEPDVVASIVAVASMRLGPDEGHNQAGTLEPGQVVTVIGRTGDQQWLQIANGGGLWVRFSAVDIAPEALADVPIVEPPPLPDSTPTSPPTGNPDATVTPSPTPSPTPAPVPNAPDFIATNAVSLEGGSILRITLTNASTSPFEGVIVVRVEQVPANPSEQILDIAVEPNGSAAVNFAIDPPIGEQTVVTVTIDPDDAIAESNEDNNVTEFIIVPPPEGAILSLSAGANEGVLSITIQNDGATLTTNDARLIVSVPGETLERVISPLSISQGESTTIDGIVAPRTGEAIRVTLFIDGANVATATVPNPNVADVPPDGQTSGNNPPTNNGPIEPDEPEEPQG